MYEHIYAVVRKIPCGKVASYGQIAAIVGKCSARVVGYALAATPVGVDIPWHRVINHQGNISQRKHGGGTVRQRQMLEAEGVRFDEHGRVDFHEVGWHGLEECN